jgi:hypothetical protein
MNKLSIGLCLLLGLVCATAQKTEKSGVYKGTVYYSDSTMHAHYDENAWWLFKHVKLLFAAIGGMLIVVRRFLEFLGAAAIVVLGVPVVSTLEHGLSNAGSKQPLPLPGNQVRLPLKAGDLCPRESRKRITCAIAISQLR